MPPRQKRQRKKKQEDASPSAPDSDIEAVRERTRKAAGLPQRQPVNVKAPASSHATVAADEAKEEEESELSELSEREVEQPPTITRAKVVISRASRKKNATVEAAANAKPRAKRAVKQKVKQKPQAATVDTPRVRKTVTREPSDAGGSALDQMAAGYDSSSASSMSDTDKPVKQEATDDSDEDAFEDVDLSAPKRASAKYDKASDDSGEDLDLTLAKAARVDLSNGKPKKRSGMEVQIRARTHYLSLLCQVAHGAWMNAWINDKELQKTLRSVLRNRNARLHKLLGKTALECAMMRQESETLHATLASAAKWFHSQYRRIRLGLRKRGYRPALYFDPDGEYETYKRAVFENPAEPDWSTTGLSAEWEACETFRDKAAFIEQASTLSGSRDYGAHLFTSLLRAYHFRCRHVFSTQPLGFKFSEREEWSPDVIAPNVTPAKRKAKVKAPRTPPSKKRKRPGSGRSSDAIRLDSSSLSSTPGSEQEESEQDSDEPASSIDTEMQTPIFWTEVFDTATQTWFAIDAMVTVRCYVAEKDLKLLQPRGKLAAAQKLGMGLVVGYGASQNAKDVTMRYAGSVTRLADSVMRSTGTSHTRFDAHRILIPFLRSHMADPAEREEDKLLAFAEKAKPKPDEMPTTLSGFQRHPRYMLEKHLREKEAFKPGAQPVGTFSVGKGAKETEERIFLRKDTVQGKTVENYHKEGRQVRMGEQPLKMIRQRAMTTARIRELQQYELEHGTPMMQPIYSVEQTEYIKPPPIVDGRIPKNAFGNADVFVPSMVPEGAVHLPHKGLSRVAKKFSFDWAEAVVGFEFKKRGAIPVVRGVLVAEEHADTLMKAFEEDEAERVRKQDQKREKAALTRWKKMLAGLRIKARIQAEYGTGGFAAASSAVADGSGSMSGPAVKGKKGKAKAKIAGIKKQDEEHVQERDENDTAFDAKPGVVDSHGGY